MIYQVPFSIRQQILSVFVPWPFFSWPWWRLSVVFPWPLSSSCHHELLCPFFCSTQHCWCRFPHCYKGSRPQLRHC